MPFSLTPRDLGMPQKFWSGWRPGQAESIDRMLDSFGRGYRWVVQNAPVGFGKSPCYFAMAVAMGWRALFVTRTLFLQTQLMDDFRSMGLVDIRGRWNYECRMASSMTCEDGAEAKCPFMNSNQCEYRQHVNDALKSQFVTTNYVYDMLIHKYTEGLGDFQLVVYDEAHEAEKAVCGVMTVRFTARHVYRMLESQFPDYPDDAESWVLWARDRLPVAVERYQEAGEEARSSTYMDEKVARELRSWRALVSHLTTISTATGPWVPQPVQTRDGTGYSLEPLWPRQYTHQILWRANPRILLPSATASEKMMDILGVARHLYDFQTYPYMFPVHRSPVYFIPSAFVGKSMVEEDRVDLHTRIAEIMGWRGDRKGLIHTVSYQSISGVEECIEYSPYKDRFITHERNPYALREAVRAFKQSEPPKALISPVIRTGFDFPYHQAEYQIIPKLFFPIVKGNRVMEMRCDKHYGDPEYGEHLLVQDLCQAIGRIMRAPDDAGECVSPETKVLRSDLSWIHACEAKVGSRLLAFDEYPNRPTGRRSDRRRWAWSDVEKCETRIMPRVRVIFEDGEIVCTPNSPWFCITAGGRIGWQRADCLKPGWKLFRFLNPWTPCISHDAGWLAGFFDGEGSLVVTQGKRNPYVSGLSVSQKEGPLLERAKELLSQFGFDYRINKQRAQQRHLVVRGGHKEILRFLGVIRPIRLLEKFQNRQIRQMIEAVGHPRVLSVERMSDGYITSLQTSSRTYIADGLGAHNTFVLDANFQWIKARRRHLFAPWALPLIQQRKTVPKPPPALWTLMHREAGSQLYTMPDRPIVLEPSITDLVGAIE